MAIRTEVSLIDDLNGRKADETVVFSLDGAAYEIDLSTANAAALRKAVQPFVAAGRAVATERRPQPVAASTRRSPKAELEAIRVWAKANRVPIADRGRISAHVRELFAAAQK